MAKSIFWGMRTSPPPPRTPSRLCLITPHPVQASRDARVQLRPGHGQDRGAYDKTATCPANMCNVAGQD